jgi:hypothetical protein
MGLIEQQLVQQPALACRDMLIFFSIYMHDNMEHDNILFYP